jgi:hypothetical protein
MSQTITLPRWAALAIAAFFAAAGGGAAVLAPDKLVVINMCQLPGADCLDIGTQPLPPDVGQIILCCDYLSGECSLAEALSDCHPEHEYAVICEHGRSLVAGGIECFD